MRTHRGPSALIAVLLLLAPVRAAGPAAFTLEQVLETPFPTGLVAAPAGGRVAWVFDAAGVRNVWVAEPPEYRGRKLTEYTEDDGQRLTDLEWAPDGRTLLYVRGGEEEGGEYPNPRDKPTVPQQEVWAVAIDKGAPRRIGEGQAPKVSPRDNRVVFLRKGQIWWAPLDGGDGPQQLLQTRGSCGSLHWSPDGSQLAFVSDRKDHSFIGVYDWAAKAVRWLDASVDLDGNPVWSPDGRQVAFIRVPAHGFTIEYFASLREAEPWSIRVADVADGKGARSGRRIAAPAAHSAKWRRRINCGGATATASSIRGRRTAGSTFTRSSSAAGPRRCSRRGILRSSGSPSVPTAPAWCTTPIRTTSTAAISGACP